MVGAVGQKRVSKEFIEEYQLPYPESITEQKRIVKILDEAFAAIDKSKENTEKNLANCRELFDSYLNGFFAHSTGSGQTRDAESGEGSSTEPVEVWEERSLGKIRCKWKVLFPYLRKIEFPYFEPEHLT